jgi:hypothetical protein
VQLDLLGTVATNRPVVSTPGDYDYGEFGGIIIGKGNRSTRRNNLKGMHPVVLIQMLLFIIRQTTQLSNNSHTQRVI